MDELILGVMILIVSGAGVICWSLNIINDNLYEIGEKLEDIKRIMRG